MEISDYEKLQSRIVYLENKLNAYIKGIDVFNNYWLDHGCRIDTMHCQICKIHSLIHKTIDRAISTEMKDIPK